MKQSIAWHQECLDNKAGLNLIQTGTSHRG